MSAIDDAIMRMHEHNLAVAREAELTGAVNTLTRIVESLAAKLDHELAELRVTVEELDYTTVKRGAFEELHTRVDELSRFTGL